MQFFKNIETLEDLKKAYRKLAVEHHPDKGGDPEIMKQVNAAYEKAMELILSGQGLNQDEIEDQILNDKRYREALDKVLILEGITIELVGNWIWISGNTFSCKTQIKEAGFLWAKKKKMWFFRTEEYKTRSKSELSFEEIKTKYDSRVIKGNTSNQFLN